VFGDLGLCFGALVAISKVPVHKNCRGQEIHNRK
jgi:hypothetical protein